MDKKLVVVIMGQNCEKFVGMCLDSVKDADNIVYCDGGSTDETTNIWNTFVRNSFTGGKANYIFNKWNLKDKQMNGKQRNFYLKYLKENYPDDWCLVLDADEIVEDLSKIKDFIQERKPGIYNVKMRHFIGDLGHEDATRPVHVVPGRLFKISEAKGYPLHSHPVLEGELMGACLDTTIWHLGHLPVEYLDYILRRYKQHSNDSMIHTKEFLKNWYYSHIFGEYPTKRINPIELPTQLLDRYKLDRDEFYFINRGLEVKHFIMTKQWKNYFNNKNILDCGCGRGPYLCAWNVMDVEAYGFDKSKYAVMNPINANTEMFVADILDYTPKIEFDLVTVIDILEHLKYEELDIALKNIQKMTNNYILFSIPFKGDPNLEADLTHIIKEDKEWWVEKLSEYFKIKDVPNDWLFNQQLLIGEKK